MAQWFYLINGKQLGPVDDKGLKELASNETITPSTKVWRDGAKGWVDAEKVKGLPFPLQVVPAKQTHAQSTFWFVVLLALSLIVYLISVEKFIGKLNSSPSHLGFYNLSLAEQRNQGMLFAGIGIVVSLGLVFIAAWNLKKVHRAWVTWSVFLVIIATLYGLSQDIGKIGDDSFEINQRRLKILEDGKRESDAIADEIRKRDGR